MRRNIDLTEEQWRQVKMQAAALGMTQSAYIGALVDAKAGKIASPIPGDYDDHHVLGEAVKTGTRK